jgi:predicted nucleic acid-binding protein
MVAFDSDFLTFLVHRNAGPPLDPRTRQPVTGMKEKIEHLIATLDKAREKILIPTPVLSEILSLCGDRANEVLAELTTHYGFEIAAFDEMAAVEAAIATAKAKQSGNKKGGEDIPWHQVKFDRQIIAIAKVRGVSVVYSDDEHVRKLAEQEGMKVIRAWELPDPPPEQTDMFSSE